MADVWTMIHIDRPAVFSKTADGGNRCWCGYYIAFRGTTEAFAELDHRVWHLEKIAEEMVNG